MVFDIYIPTLNSIGSLINSLYSIPVSSGIKNSDGRYLSCNQFVADFVGKGSPKEIQGAMDVDLIWKENHELYRIHDKLIEKKKTSLFFIEPARNAHNDVIHLLSIKTPLSHYTDAVSGIVGASIPLNQKSYQNIFSNVIKVLEVLNLSFDNQLMLQVILQALNFSQAHNQWQKNSIPFDYGAASFTYREAQCLHYFLHHYSAQKTGEKIFISPKTVEFHLSKIKRKLNCDNTSQIINLAIEYGFIDLMFMKF